MLNSDWLIDFDMFLSFSHTLSFFFYVLYARAEKYIHDFMEARDWIISQLKKLNLPTDWMLDSGIIAKVYHNLRCSALWIAYGMLEKVIHVNSLFLFFLYLFL